MSEPDELGQDEKTGGRVSPSDDLSVPLKVFEERFREQKDDWRFTIGLATGTLFFTLAFIHQVTPEPKLKGLLVLGWLALIISIIASLEVFRRTRTFLMTARDFKVSSNLFMQTVTTGKDMLKVMEEAKEIAEDLGETVRGVGGREEKLATEAHNILEEVVKLTEMATRKAATPSKLAKSIRKEILVIEYLTPVSVYGFYSGVFLVALFVVLNLIY